MVSVVGGIEGMERAAARGISALVPLHPGKKKKTVSEGATNVVRAARELQLGKKFPINPQSSLTAEAAGFKMSTWLILEAMIGNAICLSLIFFFLLCYAMATSRR